MIPLFWGALAAAQEPEPNPWTEVTEEEPAPEPEPEPELAEPEPEPEPTWIPPEPWEAQARGPAEPPKVQLSIEAGSLRSGDPAWDLFADRNRMPSWGGRLGYRLRPRLELVAGWHHVRRGSRITVPGATGGGDDFEDDSASFVAAFDGDQITLGPRVDVSIEDALLPYLQVQGMVFRGLARLDDAPNSRTNLGQVRESGLTGGVLAMAGAELRIPPGAPVVLSYHLELGYGWVAPLALGDFGEIQPGGFAVRTGFGVHF